MTTKDVQIRACDTCENGTLWENEKTNELTCDTCHENTPPPSPPSPRRKYTPPERNYTRDNEYESGKQRLIGGYKHAYYASNGSEYAINKYNDDVDGLLTPHNRNWQRAATTD